MFNNYNDQGQGVRRGGGRNNNNPFGRGNRGNRGRFNPQGGRFNNNNNNNSIYTGNANNSNTPNTEAPVYAVCKNYLQSGNCQFGNNCR